MKGAPISMDPILGLAWVGCFLLIGMLLRAYVPFFRKYLIPACIIGGVLGFAANNLGLFSYAGLGVEPKVFRIIIYHLFNLTWIFLGLQRPAAKEKQGSAAVKRQFWTVGVMITLTSAGFFTVVLAGIALKTFGGTTPASMGILTVLGFMNGPGQTLTIASIWESKANLTGAMDFGLAASSMGYLMAIIVGIPLMHLFAKRRNISSVVSPTQSEQKGVYDDGEGPVAGKQTTIPSSLDTMSFHVALGVVLYLVVLLVYGVLGHFLPPKMMNIIWGLFFVVAMGAGILVRNLFKAAGVEFVCCRNMISRLNGFLVDFLACATFISIQVGSVMLFFKPFIVTVSIVTVITAGGCWLFYKDESHEGIQRFGMMLGTLTGTISTGMVLLRMVDPESKSTAAIELGVAAFLQTPYIILYMFICHYEILMNKSPWVIVLVQFACLLAGLFMARFLRSEKYNPDKDGAASHLALDLAGK